MFILITYNIGIRTNTTQLVRSSVYLSETKELSIVILRNVVIVKDTMNKGKLSVEHSYDEYPRKCHFKKVNPHRQSYVFSRSILTRSDRYSKKIPFYMPRSQRSKII